MCYSINMYTGEEAALIAHRKKRAEANGHLPAPGEIDGVVYEDDQQVHQPGGEDLQTYGDKELDHPLLRNPIGQRATRRVVKLNNSPKAIEERIKRNRDAFGR